MNYSSFCRVIQTFDLWAVIWDEVTSSYCGCPFPVLSGELVAELVFCRVGQGAQHRAGCVRLRSSMRSSCPRADALPTPDWYSRGLSGQVLPICFITQGSYSFSPTPTHDVFVWCGLVRGQAACCSWESPIAK